MSEPTPNHAPPLRGLPSSTDAERAVLSCCLSDPHAVSRVQGALGGGERAAHAFYHPAHVTIWAAMEALYRTKSGFDLVTLGEIIRQSDELEHVGGVGYLAGLVDDVPSVNFLDHYLGILVDHAVRRAIITRMTALTTKANDFELKTADLIDEAERVLFGLRELGTDKADRTGPRLVKQVLAEDVVPAIEHAYRNRGKATKGLATGFAEFDRMTLGLEPSKLYVLAARPAMGKTSLAMNWAENLTCGLPHLKQPPVPVLVFSLEMSAEELCKRLLVSHANVDVYRIRDGFLAREDFGRVMESSGELAKLPLYIEDPANLKIHELQSRARRAVAKYGIQAVFVDYLQLIKGSSRQSESSRVNEVGEVSRGLKMMAKELNIPVVALCQLSRAADEAKYGVPKLSHLRESGDIEQDADLVGMLYRPERYIRDDEEREAVRHLAFLTIEKQRNGATGGGDAFKQKHPQWNLNGCPGIPLKFIANRVRFEDPEEMKMYG